MRLFDREHRRLRHQMDADWHVCRHLRKSKVDPVSERLNYRSHQEEVGRRPHEEQQEEGSLLPPEPVDAVDENDGRGREQRERYHVGTVEPVAGGRDDRLPRDEQQGDHEQWHAYDEVVLAVGEWRPGMCVPARGDDGNADADEGEQREVCQWRIQPEKVGEAGQRVVIGADGCADDRHRRPGESVAHGEADRWLEPPRPQAAETMCRQRRQGH